MIRSVHDDRPLRSSGGLPAQPSQPIHAGKNRFLWAFSIIMVVTAGTAFIFKLIEFFWQFSRNSTAIGGDDAMRGGFWFSIEPLLIYLIVAAGFGCLFMWAYLTGQFRDVEGPKYRMLEMQEQFDAAESRRKGFLSR